MDGVDPIPRQFSGSDKSRPAVGSARDRNLHRTHDTAEPYQHLDAAVLRAVRDPPLAGACVQLWGQCFHRPDRSDRRLAAPGITGRAGAQRRASARLTPYVRFGDWVAPLSLAVVLWALASVGLHRQLFALLTCFPRQRGQR